MELSNVQTKSFLRRLFSLVQGIFLDIIMVCFGFVLSFIFPMFIVAFCLSCTTIPSWFEIWMLASVFVLACFVAHVSARIAWHGDHFVLIHIVIFVLVFAGLWFLYALDSGDDWTEYSFMLVGHVVGIFTAFFFRLLYCRRSKSKV